MIRPVFTALALASAAASPAFALDPAAMSQTDLSARGIGLGIARTVHEAHETGTWAGGFLRGYDTDPSGAQGSEGHSRGLVLGYGFGNGLAAFAGYGQGQADLDDGDHSQRIRGYFLGVAATGEAAGFGYDAAAYVSRTHNARSGPASGAGAADFDGRLLGISLRGTRTLWQETGSAHAIDMAMQADVLHHHTKGYDITGPGGSAGERDSLAGALRLELGMPTRVGGTALRPYLAWTAYGADQDDIDYTDTTGTRTTIDAAELLDGNEFSLGTTFDAGNGFGGHFELAGGSRNRSLGFGVTMAF